jgi:hypothetical protein
MLERRHHLSLRLRKDSDRKVGKMPACVVHQGHNKTSLVKGHPSRQLGLHSPKICNKDDLATHRLCQDQNRARNE